jgi:hypothetical protein
MEQLIIYKGKSKDGTKDVFIWNAKINGEWANGYLNKPTKEIFDKFNRKEILWYKPKDGDRTAPQKSAEFVDKGEFIEEKETNDEIDDGIPF